MIATRELIECLKSLSDEERREVASLLLPQAATPSQPADRSGLRLNQKFFADMTPEQLEEVRQLSQLAS